MIDLLTACVTATANLVPPRRILDWQRERRNQRGERTRRVQRYVLSPASVPPVSP